MITKEFVVINKKPSEYSFITEIVQKGKAKPKKFKHFIELPSDLYAEIKNAGVVNIEDLYVNEDAFFEFMPGKVIINCIHLYQCEDLHRKIDHYLIVKLTGSYPLKRGGFFF